MINVLVPSVIKRAYHRPAFVTGLYITAMMGGGGLATALTVPMKDALGGWDVALAAWALPAMLAALAWLPAVGAASREPDPPAVPLQLWKDGWAWLLSCFFACQTFLGYAVVAWVPKILDDSGLGEAGAGVMAAIFMVMGIPTALLVPVLVARTGRAWVVIVAMIVAWWMGLAGLLFAPGTATTLWMALLGLAQGGGFALPLTLVVLRARDSRHAASLSAMVQGPGYAVGAASPPVTGVLHDLTERGPRLSCCSSASRAGSWRSAGPSAARAAA